MRILKPLFDNNRAWAEEIKQRDPAFFEKLSPQQFPKYLWIGCSDSRVPANEIVGLSPGELFVHRNIANLVLHTDLNCLSVLHYAVEVLKVEHVIVCGHYGCGGVQAAMQDRELGLIDNWLGPIKALYRRHREQHLEGLGAAARLDRFCELNVIEQVYNACHTTVVQRAWRQGQTLAVHGWIYGLQDGLLRDLNVTVISRDEVEATFRTALSCAPSDG